ncbi:Plasmodium exported protein, unknown function [Plasmodium ovale wallikeri]|uniref:Pv-fam-d protein n=1 Tax=Plasmodium ovale wallikeri TaxID=864142 RepID=A0A1A8YHX6_PLAOA|nr:Plasmodium exported protein, unknown function [Plasmodium ovale wallikeri]SBT57191.1 Plasmodium exported protein, unknown function [Plasmodium ovale wallikeri]
MFFFSKTLIYSLLLWASNYLYETTTLCELTNYRHNVNISLDKKYKGLFKGGVNHGIEHDYMGLKERIMNLENEDDNCFGERLNALVNDDYFRKQFNKLIHGDEFQTKIDELIKNGKFEKPFKSLDLGNNYEEMFNDLENYHNFEENMNPFKNHNNLEEYFDELKRINDYINEQNDELANVNNYYRSFPDLTKYDDHLDIEYTAEKQRYMDEVEYDCIINKRKKSKFSKILKKLDMKIYKFLRKMNSKLESELIRYINMKYFNLLELLWDFLQ